MTYLTTRRTLTAALVAGVSGAALADPVLSTDVVLASPTADDVRAGPVAATVVPADLSPGLADVDDGYVSASVKDDEVSC